jgi:hypothetical protein
MAEERIILELNLDSSGTLYFSTQDMALQTDSISVEGRVISFGTLTKGLNPQRGLFQISGVTIEFENLSNYFSKLVHAERYNILGRCRKRKS